MPEMINIPEWASDNLLAMWIAGRGLAGHFAGFDQLEPSDTGSDSGMRRLRGGVNFPSPVTEPERATTRGDGKILARWRRNPTQDNAYIIEMAVRDVIAETFMGGGQPYALGAYRLLGILGSSIQRSLDSILLMHRSAQSMVAGGGMNNEGYENLVVFSNILEPLGPEAVAQDDDGNARYSGMANRVTILPYGVTVEDAADYSDGILASYITAYPDMYHCVIGDGSLTSIVVDKEPVDDQIWRVEVIDFTAGGTFKTVTSVTPATKTIVVTGALTDEHVYLVIYQMHPKELG